MPTYTYQCKNCGKTQDEFHSMSAKPRIKCNVCGGSCKRMLGTGAGVIFKGSGFYETDYKSRKGAGSEPAKSDSSNGSSESKPESSKSESKSSKSGEKTTSSSSSSE